MKWHMVCMQGGRGTEELERERKMHSSTARGLQGTAIPGSRRPDQMALQGVPAPADYNSEYLLGSLCLVLYSQCFVVCDDCIIFVLF